MKRSIPLIALSWAFSPILLFAQPSDRCGSQAVLERQLQEYPQMKMNRQVQEAFTRQFADRHDGRSPLTVITIPVVFHVVYENSNENIPDYRLDSQLVALNRDYRKLNGDAGNVPQVWQSLASDCEIQFCRAVTDPDGMPTSGITRTQTSVTSFSMNNDVMFTSLGGHDIWDRDRYLNIWVCDLTQGTLGYAAFPGGSPSTDGVVLDYAYTGTTGALSPYNKGRSGTHEVGHWLNLEHIWGNDGGSCAGTDYCNDTPNQGNWNFSCYSPGTVITDNCSTTAPGIMWMNYMDYTEDACMYMFTFDQKVRMQATLNGVRSSILNSTACLVSVPEMQVAAAFSVFPSPSDGLFSLRPGQSNVRELEIEIYNSLGQAVLRKRFSFVPGTDETLDLREFPDGMYVIRGSGDGSSFSRKIMIRR